MGRSKNPAHTLYPKVEPSIRERANTIVDPVRSYQAGYLDGIHSVSDAAKRFVKRMRLYSGMDDSAVLSALLSALNEFSNGAGAEETEMTIIGMIFPKGGQ